MGMRRISIAGLLGFVAVFAISLAALVNATYAWRGAVFTLTMMMLFASVLGVIFRGWRTGGWLGFALFGWGYLLLGTTLPLSFLPHQRLLTDLAADWVFEKSNHRPIQPLVVSMPPPPAPPVPVLPAPVSDAEPPSLTPPPELPPPPAPPIVPMLPPSDPSSDDSMALLQKYEERAETARGIGYWLSILVFAGVGAILGMLLARGPRRGELALADRLVADPPGTGVEGRS
jgi:hypothetical protein